MSCKLLSIKRGINNVIVQQAIKTEYAIFTINSNAPGSCEKDSISTKLIILHPIISGNQNPDMAALCKLSSSRTTIFIKKLRELVRQRFDRKIVLKTDH